MYQQVFITTRVCAVLAILADALLLAITWRVLGPSGRGAVSFRGKGLVYVMLRDSLLTLLPPRSYMRLTQCLQERYTPCEHRIRSLLGR